MRVIVVPEKIIGGPTISKKDIDLDSFEIGSDLIINKNRWQSGTNFTLYLKPALHLAYDGLHETLYGTYLSSLEVKTSDLFLPGTPLLKMLAVAQPDIMKDFGVETFEETLTGIIVDGNRIKLWDPTNHKYVP